MYGVNTWHTDFYEMPEQEYMSYLYKCHLMKKCIIWIDESMTYNLYNKTYINSTEI